MPDEAEPTEEELELRLKKLLGEAETADADELDAIELKLRDVESKLDAGSRERKERDGFFDSEFEERLEKLHERADQAKDRQHGVAQAKEREQRMAAVSTRGLGVGLSIAYTITGLPLLGVLIGWLVDRSQGTTSGKGIGVMIGVAVALAMAFMMMKRSDNE